MWWSGAGSNRRPSAFQAGHTPRCAGSYERYAVLSVAISRRRSPLLLSTLLSAQLGPPASELRITSLFSCVARGSNPRASLIFLRCPPRRLLGVDGGPGTSRGHVPCSPSLLCGLAGDAEPGADLGPGVAVSAQALDRLGDGAVQLVREPGHEAECFDIAVCDVAAVGAQDASDELPVLVVLDTPSPPVGCQSGLDTGSPTAAAATKSGGLP
jgi:hypothetical protein